VLIGQLATALIRRGHRVRLVTYGSGTGQQPQGIEIHRTPAPLGLTAARPAPSWRKPLLDLLLARELLQVTRRWPGEVLHVHNFEGLLAALFVRRLTGVPVIYHVHNAMGLELHTYFRSRLGQWVGAHVGRWVDANLARQADYCILLVDEAVSYFRERGVTRLRVVPPGIDFEPGDAAQVRQELGDGPLVLYSGNLDPYQDLDSLLAAFRLVADARPDARLVFSTSAGTGRLKAQVEALGIGAQTVFLAADDFDRVRHLLAAADVAVCPRKTCLGFPIKLLNYMAAGRAIVAAEGSASGLRHLEDGWVVANGDTAGMARAIVALLADPGLARRLGEEARRTVRQKYTWDRAVEAIEEVYEHAGQAGIPRGTGSPSTRRQY
jgi:glycosyltransferase involved in cell wall biosynthesis